MHANDYQKEAMTLLNPDIPADQVLLNAVLGLCGESGEAADLLKKHLFQGHELDKQTMMKELGDVAWYLAEACEGLGVRLSDVMQMNLDKLHRRYPDGFSADRSRCRQEDDQA
ncbi:MAG: nucleotide pyrophosphohydrolase [Clostridiales bacterium]|nr:nucleotide pyrophosphohydrolase [Clostridiales bacterium]